MSTTNFSTDPGTAHSEPDESSGVKDQAQQAASAASDEGKRVAGVAQAELKNVTAEAQNQLRGLLDQAATQVDEQSREQKGRLAETVRTFGDDLHGMTSENGGGLAVQLVQQVGDQARGLASHLDDRDPRELLDDVRTFARRRPGTFLLGALVAGVVVGRVTRGAKAAQDNPSAGAGKASVPSSATYQSQTSLIDATQGTAAGAATTGIRPEADLGGRGVQISEAGAPTSSRGPA